MNTEVKQLEEIERELGIKPGETTENLRFSLEDNLRE